MEWNGTIYENSNIKGTDNNGHRSKKKYKNGI